MATTNKVYVKRLEKWADTLEEGKWKQARQEWFILKDGTRSRAMWGVINKLPKKPEDGKACCLTVAHALIPKKLNTPVNYSVISNVLCDYYGLKEGVSKFVDMNDKKRYSFNRIAKYIREKVIPSLDKVTTR